MLQFLKLLSVLVFASIKKRKKVIQFRILNYPITAIIFFFPFFTMCTEKEPHRATCTIKKLKFSQKKRKKGQNSYHNIYHIFPHLSICTQEKIITEGFPL